MGVRTSELVLDAVQIDELSEQLAAFLEGADIDHRGAISCRLAFESCLMRLHEHFGDGTVATCTVGKRLGRPRFEVSVPGERFDPRAAQRGSDWERSLMENSGLQPLYAYRGGRNIVSVTHPLPELGSTFVSLIAIVLGIAISYAGGYLPVEVRTMLLNDLIDPLVDVFVAMLAGIAGPLVFFSVAWGICGIGDMAALGRSGKNFISRFIGANVMSMLLALALAIVVIPARGQGGAGNVLADMVELVLGLLPTNLFKPFVEGNTLQIIVLAAATGIAALALGDGASSLRSALRSLNTLMQFLMEQLCRLLPGFILVMMVSQAWSGTAKALLSSWLPILLATGLIVVFLALTVIVTCVRLRLSVVKVVLRLVPLGFLAFTTASPSASFGTMLSTCRDEFGVDDDQTSFGVPLGMVLCKPASPILLVVVILYCLKMYGGGGAGVFWYVQLGVTCVLYTIAVPPVPGGMLACYGMIFASLGIPAGAIGVATALDLLLDNPVACTNVLCLVLQVLSAADSLDAVDQRVLDRLRGRTAR